MKEYNIEILKDAAHRLLFDMPTEQYETLVKEFDVIIAQMKVLGENPLIDQYEPMVFPFECKTSYLREDREEALKNAHNKTGGQIKLPKVVI